jgi:hypothetical protein
LSGDLIRRHPEVLLEILSLEGRCRALDRAWGAEIVLEEDDCLGVREVDIGQVFKT